MGRSQANEDILLDGCEFGVRQNLLNALQQLRRHKEQVLWIDAVFIGQSSILQSSGWANEWYIQ